MVVNVNPVVYAAHVSILGVTATGNPCMGPQMVHGVRSMASVCNPVIYNKSFHDIHAVCIRIRRES